MNADIPRTAEPQPTADPVASRPIRDRFRVRFAKVGLLRWIGHRDLQRLWERLLRRVGLPLAMTDGFHPKPRIGFPSALALGVEGLDEVVEIEVTRELSAAELHAALVADNQPGLEIGDVRLVARASADGTPDPTFANLAKARLHSSEYDLEIPAAYLNNVRSAAQIDAAIDEAKSHGAIRFVRKQREATAGIPAPLALLDRRDNRLALRIVEDAGTSLKPTEVLDGIGLSDLIEHGGILRRTRVILVDEVVDPTPAPTGELTANPAAIHRNNPSDTLQQERS